MRVSNMAQPLVGFEMQNTGIEAPQPTGRKSNCVQARIYSLSEALNRFQHNDGEGNIPMVLIPHESCIGLNPISNFSATVPTGCFCLKQEWGKDAGLAQGGLQAMPPWRRISHIVTQQSVTYNAPVKECPTKDNVRVSVDMTVVFAVRDARAFVYKMGVRNFNAHLGGAIEESIRVLVRSLTYHAVWKLRGNRADSLIMAMNKKFEEPGVVFSNVTITAVHLPSKLARSLERTTELQKQMDKMEREQVFEMNEIRRQGEMEINELRKKKENQIVKCQGELKRAEAGREQEMTQAEEKRRVLVIEAEQTSQVGSMEVQAELERKKLQMRQLQVQQVSQKQADADAERVAAQVDYRKYVADGDATLAELEAKAKAIEFDSAAEAANVDNLKQSRAHELAMKEREVLALLAKTRGGKLLADDGVISMNTGTEADRSKFTLLGSHADSLVDAITAGTISAPSARKE